MIKNYFKTAWRTFLKNKVNTSINILGLSIGITCCIIVLIFVKYESNFDDFHPYSEQTYRVVQHTEFAEQTMYWNTTAYPLAEALRNDLPDIEIVTQTAGPVKRFISIEDQNKKVLRFEDDYILFADSFFPKVFQLDWIIGNPDTALQNPSSIVLTEDLAKKYFGKDAISDQSIIGRIVKMNGKDPLTVTGIIKNAPGNTTLRYNMLIPYEFFKMHNRYFAENWSGNYQGTTFVTLDKKIDKTIIESKIATWKKKYLKPEDDNRISYFLQPLKEIHTQTLYGSSPGGYIMPQKVINTAYIVALFILIVAIINFVNLITAQSSIRSKEVGVRKVIGGSRYHLISQFILENVALIIITICFALFFIQFLLEQINQYLTIINLQLLLRWEDIGLIIAIGGVTILLAAIYPAFVLSSFNPIRALKSKIISGNGRKIGFRKVLIVFQFIIVQLFVIAAIVIATQIDYFRNKETGFSSDAVVTMPAPDFDKLQVFRTSLLQNKNIAKVAFGSGPPMAVERLRYGTTFRLPQQSEEERQETEMKVAGINYLDFYDLQLIAGRNFITTKRRFDEFIVNEKLIQSKGWTPQEAIGKKLVINEGEATIVGVVKDYHNSSLQSEITPCILINWNSIQNQVFVKIKNGNYKSLEQIEEIWNDTFTSAVYTYNFLNDSIEKEYLLERLIFNGVTLLSILAISIGCMGLLSLMSFITMRKRKEVGIRKVLGASAMQIVSFFSREFMVLIIIAFLITVPVIYYILNLWLESFTYRIELSIWMFLSGGLLTLIIAIITSGFQSVKAAIANPINSLRTE
ncbi:ABC transporter permease [Aquimarina sp. 2201CG5-10]|uniref:ABC transporter permease n=1 Tax=Aquimarina callyspongiae TaxID=3098150 RepID=UPI002AB561D4|nr:ABC transporter permease [Aquimarina sp. 2201CG5-10]MDY8137532.1 ABC transporter permease [Aquimarina sp. 2201CG5-10]